MLGVRHHHDGGSLLIQFAEQLHHLHTILGIEVTRRLIGKDDARFAHHGTGDGNPLLLTARKLMRIMLGTMAQLHLSQNFEHTLLALRLPHSEVFQLQIHILLNGKFVDKIEVLEHEADATLAIGGTLTLLQMAHFLIIQPILALRRTIQQTQDVQQG